MCVCHIKWRRPKMMNRCIYTKCFRTASTRLPTSRLVSSRWATASDLAQSGSARMCFAVAKDVLFFVYYHNNNNNITKVHQSQHPVCYSLSIRLHFVLSFGESYFYSYSLIPRSPPAAGRLCKSGSCVGPKTQGGPLVDEICCLRNAGHKNHIISTTNTSAA